MNLTQGQRKQIAEWMGREAVIIPDDNPFSEDDTPLVMLVADGAIYTPDTNDSQAMELLRKWLTEIEDTLPRQQYMNKVLRLMGKLDNLSICHAVLDLEE